MSHNDGGMAFPRHAHKVENADGTSTYYYSQDGMSLRDYFAAQALPAVIAAYQLGNGACIGTDHVLRNTTVIAFKIADAMLEARRAS